MKVFVVCKPAHIYDEYDSDSAMIYGVFSDQGQANAVAEKQDGAVYECEMDRRVELFL